MVTVLKIMKIVDKKISINLLSIIINNILKEKTKENIIELSIKIFILSVFQWIF